MNVVNKLRKLLGVQKRPQLTSHKVAMTEEQKLYQQAVQAHARDINRMEQAEDIKKQVRELGY